MKCDIFTYLVTIAGVIPSASSLPLPQWPTLSHRRDADACNFYGKIVDGKKYNIYNIDLSIDDINELSSKCGANFGLSIKSNCGTELGDFVCEPPPESSQSAHLSFNMVRLEGFQPVCVSNSLKETKLVIGNETIDCFCLAGCGPGEDADSDPSRRERTLLGAALDTGTWGRLYNVVTLGGNL